MGNLDRSIRQSSAKRNIKMNEKNKLINLQENKIIDLTHRPDVLKEKLNLIPVNINRVKQIIKKSDEEKKKKKNKMKKWSKEQRHSKRKQINNFLKRNEKRVMKKMIEKRPEYRNLGHSNFSNKKIKSKIRASSLELKPKSSQWRERSRDSFNSLERKSRDRRENGSISATDFMLKTSRVRTPVKENLRRPNTGRKGESRRNKSMIGLNIKKVNSNFKKESQKENKSKTSIINNSEPKNNTLGKRGNSLSNSKKSRSSSKTERGDKRPAYWKSTKDIIDFFREEMIKEIKKNEKNEGKIKDEKAQKKVYYQIPRKIKTKNPSKKNEKTRNLNTSLPASPITQNPSNTISNKRKKKKKKIVKRSVLEEVKEESENEIDQYFSGMGDEDKISKIPFHPNYCQKPLETPDSVLYRKTLQFQKCKNVRTKFFNEFILVNKLLNDNVKGMNINLREQARRNNQLPKEKNLEIFLNELKICQIDEAKQPNKLEEEEIEVKNYETPEITEEEELQKIYWKTDSKSEIQLENSVRLSKTVDYRKEGKDDNTTVQKQEENFFENSEEEEEKKNYEEILDFIDIDNEEEYMGEEEGLIDFEDDDEDFDPNSVPTRMGTNMSLSSTVSKIISRHETNGSNKNKENNKSFLLSAVTLIEKIEEMKIMEKLG